MKAAKSVFDAVVPAGLQIATKIIPLSQVERAWNDTSKEPIVFLILVGCARPLIEAKKMILES